MPLVRRFRGREIKDTKRVQLDGKAFIRVTYYGEAKNEPGPQELVPEPDYVENRTIEIVPANQLKKAES